MIRSKIPSLDGLRAVSIFFVMATHLNYAHGCPRFLDFFLIKFNFGALGVAIFFVISGFLITTLLLEEKSRFQGKVNVRLFYIRRVLRIFPVYYLYIAAAYALYRSGYAAGSQNDFIHALTYTVNFWGTSWVLIHVWSLAVEEQFYLFWPWVVRMSRKWIIAIGLLFMFYAPAARAIEFYAPAFKYWSLSPFFGNADSLMIGALLGLFLHERPNVIQGEFFKNNFLRLLCGILILISEYLSSNGLGSAVVIPFGRLVSSACTGYLLVSFIAVRNDGVFRFLNLPVMRYVGALSYSLYIWQQLFLYKKTEIMADVWWRSFPANLICVFVAACLSYHLWERPILNFRDKFKKA